MVQRHVVSVILKLCSLGLTVSAGSFWAGAAGKSRPKNKDEQTLIGGTIWSQILIPIGLIISKSMGEDLDTFVHAYFLFVGLVLLFITGIFLVTREFFMVTKHRRTEIENAQQNHKNMTRELKFDKIYFLIGILSLVAGCLTLADFILIILVES